MGLILLVVARILQWALAPVFVIYATLKYGFTNWRKLDKYFGNIAFGRDQLGNAMGGPIMNDLLLKEDCVKLFGNVDETISHVIGVNYIKNKMTWLGRLIARILNNAEAQHVESAAKTNQNNTNN